MPPKKKARTKSKSDEELEKLVKWLSREQLEGFVMNSVKSGSLSVKNLWSSVPERAIIEIRKTSAPVKVSAGQDRVGTGSFNELDASIVREIFSYCGLLDKITCVTSVCRAWRGYKSIPGLFTDLSERLATSRKPSIYNHASFFCSLLDFVPDLASVEAMRMATSKSDDHNLLNKIFKRLGALKSEAEKQGTTFHLKKLVLQGAKLSPTVMTRLSASGICGSLTSLVFDDVYDSKKLSKEDAIPNLLKACPNLEQLVAPADLFRERSLSFHLGALANARSGAPPVLTTLDLSSGFGWYGNDAVSWALLSNIGTHLPCLQSIKLQAITVDTPVQSDPSIDGFTEATPSLSDFLVKPFAPMPNLKVFQVGRIMKAWDFRNELTPRYVTTPYLTKIMTRLTEAAPALETLDFGHGTHTTPSKKTLRTGRLIVPPLPTLELGMLNLPSGLKELSLNSVLLKPSEFMGLDVRRFESIQFRNCGPFMMEIIQLLHRQSPQLTLKVSDDGALVRLSRIG